MQLRCGSMASMGFLEVMGFLFVVGGDAVCLVGLCVCVCGFCFIIG